MTTNHGLVHELILKRWSPRAFLDKPVEPEKLTSLFEAARWAASSYNEQPWRFLVATREDAAGFGRMLDLLVPQNQAWAKSAWVLGLTVGKKTFSHNGAPNRFGVHDAGAGLANLMLQATAVGLHVHGMGGFHADKARVEFGIPEDFEVGAAFAVGYVDGEEDPPAERTRRGLGEIWFGTEWGKAFE